MHSEEGKELSVSVASIVDGTLPALQPGTCVLEDGVGSVVTMNTFFQGTKARQGAVSRKGNEHRQKEP